VLLHFFFLFFWRILSEVGLKDSRKGKMPGYFHCLFALFLFPFFHCFSVLFLFCVTLSADSSFFFSGEKERTKEKRHFWQTAPQPKEALLRFLVARVILFVCAGATAPHVMAPLFVFFSARVLLAVSSHCFCFFFVLHLARIVLSFFLAKSCLKQDESFQLIWGFG